MAEKEVNLGISADAAAVIASLRRVEDATRTSAMQMKASLDEFGRELASILARLTSTHIHPKFELISRAAKPFKAV